MQKWEYLYVALEYSGSELKPRSINGQGVPDWKNSLNFNGSLPLWGEEGWELISFVVTKNDGSSYHEADGFRAIFKRPKD
jgi:hypothetical protein